MTGAKFRKMGHLTLTMPLLGGFVIQKLRLDIIYLCAKFDHSSFSPRCGIARLTIYFLNASPVNAKFTTPYYFHQYITCPFSTNMAISETKGQRWRAINTQ